MPTAIRIVALLVVTTLFTTLASLFDFGRQSAASSRDPDDTQAVLMSLRQEACLNAAVLGTLFSAGIIAGASQCVIADVLVPGHLGRLIWRLIFGVLVGGLSAAFGQWILMQFQHIGGSDLGVVFAAQLTLVLPILLAASLGRRPWNAVFGRTLWATLASVVAFIALASLTTNWPIENQLFPPQGWMRLLVLGIATIGACFVTRSPH